MKFACERCGKRFASVDEPAPGRVYRIRCRCGNFILISAPHAESERTPLDMPLVVGATVASSAGRANTPIPSPARSAIGAGDATSRVHATTAVRISDPAVPRRTVPAVSASVPGSTTGSHPLATPVSALDGADAPAPPPWFEPAFAAPSARTPVPGMLPRESTSSVTPGPKRPTSTPAAFGVTADVPIPPDAVPAPQPDPAGRSAAPNDLALPVAPVPLPAADPFADPFAAAAPAVSPDPFAAAAAHAARQDPFDTTAPVATRPPLPPAPEPAQPPASARATDDEAPVQLSRSEQYELEKPKRRAKTSAVSVAGAVVALGLVGAGGALFWKLHGGGLPDSVPAPAVARPPVAAAPAGVPPRAASTVPAAAAPAPAPAPPTPPAPLAAAAPPPPSAATSSSAGAVAPPSAAAPPAGAQPVATAPGAPAEPAPVAASAPPAGAAATPVPAPAPAPAAGAAAPAPAPPEPPPASPRLAAAAPARPKPADRPSRSARAAEHPREPQRKVAAAAREPPRSEAAPVRAPEPERSAPTPAPSPPPKAAPPPAAPPPVATPRREEPPARKAETEGLDPAVLQSVIARTRPWLDLCVERALQDPATASYAGRKAALLILVSPNGKAEAALEDAELDASPLGNCLRRAAAKMSFPQFRGEDVGARIVLVLGRAN